MNFLRTLLFFVLGFASFGAAAAETTLNWQAPTQNTDGTPLTDLAGYRVYFGYATRDYVVSADVNDPNATTATVTVPLGLVPGDNYIFIAMTAIDSQGNESAYSNEITRIINVVDDIAPNAPVIITVTITVDVDCPAGFSCTTQ